jgi:ribosomal protein S18 acetylase RimI-like enzyme
VEYPSQFELEGLLNDGRTVNLRPIRPADADREHEFFQRVGHEGAYYRFFAPKPDLSPRELRYFTTVDYDTRMAFVAIHEDDTAAVGRYDRLPEKNDEGRKVAEIALLVQDNFQRVGIGSHLLQQLASHARLRGVTDFEAIVLAENQAVLGLLRSSGYGLTRQFEEGIFRVDLSIEDGCD